MSQKAVEYGCRMKQYWSIPGWKDAPKGLPCMAFEKFDGSNVRIEYNCRREEWYKYGSRNVLLDPSNPDLGPAISTFESTLAEPIAKVIKDEKYFRGIQSVVVFCEFLGPNSFAGLHVASDPKEMVLFDVNPHKKGFMLPREFVKMFGHLNVPKVVYEGNFNHEFITAVREGQYPVKEGVVVKGIKPGSKRDVHGLWFSKVKTNWWLNELRTRAQTNEQLRRVLADNLTEQGTNEVVNNGDDVGSVRV